MPMPNDLRILLPWEALGSDRAKQYSRQIERDLPPEHRLAGVRVVPVAARVDRDDLLLELEGDEALLAVII